jgi:hypothetical protein
MSYRINMPRLLRFILFLSFIAALMLLAVRLLGGTRPAMALTTIMSKPDGTACDRPCLFGVRPGETSFEQARQILHSHPVTHDAHWLTPLTLQLTGPTAYITFSLTPDNLVDSISFTDNLDDSGTPVKDSLVDSIHLGELILAFGTPNVLLPDSPYFVMGFPNTGIIAASARSGSNEFVKPEASVSTLMVYTVRPCPKNTTIFNVHPWMGFTTMKRYITDLRQYRFPHRISGVTVPPFAQCQV